MHALKISRYKMSSFPKVHLCPEMQVNEIQCSLWKSITKCHIHLTSYLTRWCGKHFINLHFWTYISEKVIKTHRILSNMKWYENDTLWCTFIKSIQSHQNAFLDKSAELNAGEIWNVTVYEPTVHTNASKAELFENVLQTGEISKGGFVF